MEQKEYIVKELYPSLKQALMHFLDRSSQTKHYMQIVESDRNIKNAVDLQLNKTEIEKLKHEEE